VQEVGSRKQEVARGAVRGTQSFVGVMTAVWKRPSLAGLEIGWRWLVGIVAFGLAGLAFGSRGLGAKVDLGWVRNASVFQPVGAINGLRDAASGLWNYASPVLRWMVPAVIVLWLVGAAVGRTVVLRRLDGGLHARRFAMLVLGALRTGLLAVVWGIWVWGIGVSVRVSITGPAARAAEPSIVLFCAMLIVGSLALYVLWGAVSWPLYLAPLLAMQLGLGAGDALRAAFKSGAVRGKLIVINMVLYCADRADCFGDGFFGIAAAVFERRDADVSELLVVGGGTGVPGDVGLFSRGAVGGLSFSVASLQFS